MNKDSFYKTCNNLINNGLFDDAIKYLQLHKAQYEQDKTWHQLLAITYVKQNNLDNALECLNQALEFLPDNPDLISERGVVYFHLNKKSLALMDMEQAAKLDFQNPYRYSSRAFIKDSMGDLEGAIADYEKAISLDPQDAIAHNNLGLLQEKLGYNQKAQQNFTKADKLAKEFDTLWKKEHPPVQKESENNSAETNKKPSLNSHLKIAGKVFTDKNMFREFASFWKTKLFGKKN